MNNDSERNKIFDNNKNAKIALIMGSQSDWPVMKCSAEILDDFGIKYESLIISAHRTPERMREFAINAKDLGFEIIIAGAGGAAHLPGMVASQTTLPVLGVPVTSRNLKGLDSLLSIVQMPGGIPVATFAIGEAGAKNAALFAIAQLANNDADIALKLQNWRDNQEKSIALYPSDEI